MEHASGAGQDFNAPFDLWQLQSGTVRLFPNCNHSDSDIVRVFMYIAYYSSIQTKYTILRAHNHILACMRAGTATESTSALPGGCKAIQAQDP